MELNENKVKYNYGKIKNIEDNFVCFEDIEKDPELLKQIIEESQKEYEEGKCRPIEEFWTEMEEKQWN